MQIDKDVLTILNEAEDFDAILQVFKDLDLAITISSDLDELNATCLSLIKYCKENDIRPSTVVKALSQEAKDRMQRLWSYEDPLTDEDILTEFWNLEEVTESKNKVEAKSKNDTECPVCSSQDIDYYSLNDEGTKVRRQCSCNNCNSTFEFVYNLALDEIENVVDNSKEK